MKGADKATVEKVHALEQDIMKKSEQIIQDTVAYMRLLGMTGIKTPTPPRPKREAVAKVGIAAVMLEAAHKALKGI